MGVLMGLDIGSSSIKACVYDPVRGELVKTASRPTPVLHPQPDWSEHDPQELRRTVCAVIKEAVLGQPPVDGLAISSFGEAGLPLDVRGAPLYNVIAWHDRRCAPQVSAWEARFTDVELHAVTGQRVSASFGAVKWLWLRENIPGLAEKTACWLSTPDYIAHCLTGVARTDRSIASRTLLYDQYGQRWSPDLLQFSGLSSDQLPQPGPGGALVGRITPSMAVECGLPVGVPVMLGGHDHLCAAFACGLYRTGVMVDSTGTAEALLMCLPNFVTGQAFASAGYACYAHTLDGLYVLKGGLKLAGGALEWLGRLLSQGKKPDYAALQADASAGVGSARGPMWLPHLIGSGSPEGDNASRAALVGAAATHTRGDLFRAMLEAQAFWLKQNVIEMERLTGRQGSEILLTGGVTRLELLSQIKADCVNRPVGVVELSEAAAVGAALLAGLGVGVFKTPEEAARSVRAPVRWLPPDPVRADHYNRLYELYTRLYPTLRDFHRDLTGVSE